MGKNQSKDFRYVFVNAFGMRISDNDVTLTLGMHEGGDPKDMLEEVAVVMTPKTLKIIINNVQNVITQFESDVGEILIPPGKVASMEEMTKTGAATIKKPARTSDVRRNQSSHSGNAEFTILFCAKEKGGKFVPLSACGKAIARRDEVLEDRSRTNALWLALE